MNIPNLVRRDKHSEIVCLHVRVSNQYDPLNDLYIELVLGKNNEIISLINYYGEPPDYTGVFDHGIQNLNQHIAVMNHNEEYSMEQIFKKKSAYSLLNEPTPKQTRLNAMKHKI